MPHYTFPGFSAFLEDAAHLIGHPEAELPARRIATLAALGNLCAQAGVADRKHVPQIMAKALEFRDQLHLAYQAAEIMILDVHRALGLDLPNADKCRSLRVHHRNKSAHRHRL